jgi:uncharacterized protein YbjT (DUF2867 family)
MNEMQRILVVGGSGGVGGELVRQLLARGHRVRVSSRRAEAKAWPEGVEAVRGDLEDPASLRACGEGCAAAFLYVPMKGDLAAAAVELRRAGVERAVVLSTIDAANDSAAAAFNRARHIEGEEGVAASGLRVTCLRPGAFASNALRFFLPQLDHGDVVRLPFPGAQQAPIDTRDIARVAVRALTTGDLDGQRPVLTGPRSISQHEQVAALGRALGRRLTVETLSPEVARATMLARIPERYVDMLIGQWEEETHGAATVTDEVERITGVPATRYDDALAWVLKTRDA